MFAIDLLKGKGLPQKTNWRLRITHAAGLLLPVAALAVLAGAWRYDHLQLTAQENGIWENEKIISQYSDQTTAYRQSSARVADLRKQFNQVAAILGSRIQVSDLFRELTDKLPEEIFLYEIKLDRTANKEKYQAEGAKEVQQRTVIRRNLTLVLCNYNTSGGDRLVEDYVAELKKSSLTSSVFKDIKPASRQQGMVDEREATYYYIECVLVEQKQ
jgi:hypothetical protein